MKNTLIHNRTKKYRNFQPEKTQKIISFLTTLQQTDN